MDPQQPAFARPTSPAPPFTQQDLLALLAPRDTPSLSLYMPTHRRFPENRQDPIRYKNLLKALEESLLRRLSPAASDTLLEPFRSLAADTAFWNQAWDGLAVFGAPGYFRVLKLQQSVPDLAIAADSFHVKPLLRILQSAERFQVLTLNRREIRLFEGDRDRLDEVPLAPGVPRTITEALGDELTEPHQTVASYGGTQLGSNMRHGHGSRQDEVDIDEERFFRLAGRAILEKHSTPSGLPLILAALPQYHASFRELSSNPFVLEQGIAIDPSSLTEEQLRERAWAVVAPTFGARVRQLVDSFGAAQVKGMGTDDVARAAAAAAESRVETLLLDAARRLPGRIDQSTGEITPGAIEDPEVDDLLDDLAELVLSKGGQVFVLPAAEMPTPTGVAATFRY